MKITTLLLISIKLLKMLTNHISNCELRQKTVKIRMSTLSKTHMLHYGVNLIVTLSIES